jgi:hypothetical protein
MPSKLLQCTAPSPPVAAAPTAGVVRWLAGLFGSGDTDATATGVKTIHFIRHGHATSNVAVEKVMAEHGIPHDQINSVLSVRAALTKMGCLFFVPWHCLRASLDHCSIARSWFGERPYLLYQLVV